MNLKEANDAIEEGYSLKTIAQAYSEIANQKVKRIRNEALRNRLFFKEIFEVYAIVKQMAITKKIVFEKPKKRVSLMVTSNYRFNGNINNTLIKFFTSSLKNVESDIIVIGKSGSDHFKNTGIFPGYKPVILKTDQPSPDELKALIEMVKDYNQVLVFYSELKTLLVQQPQVRDITATSVKAQVNVTDIHLRFIFEPELKKMLEFFDSQILTLLLEQIFLESEVARTAARFSSMDQAETQANIFIKEHKKIRSFIIRNIKNNELLEAVAALKGSGHGGI